MADKKEANDLMGCNQQAMPCSELTIARTGLSSNLSVPHAFPCWLLAFFVTHVIIFWQWQTS